MRVAGEAKAKKDYYQGQRTSLNLFLTLLSGIKQSQFPAAQILLICSPSALSQQSSFCTGCTSLNGTDCLQGIPLFTHVQSIQFHALSPFPQPKSPSRNGILYVRQKRTLDEVQQHQLFPELPLRTEKDSQFSTVLEAIGKKVP